MCTALSVRVGRYSQYIPMSSIGKETVQDVSTLSMDGVSREKYTHMTNKIEKFLSEESQTRENEWLIKCPAHHDTDPSLSISFKEEDNRYVLFCHGGCEYPDILDAMKLKSEDLFLEKKIIAEYIYKDENGKQKYRKVRYQPKDFRIEVKVGGKWEKGTGEKFERYLFRLPELLSAPETPILFVESEKSVLALEEAGFLATTSGGANTWDKGLAKWLNGRRVYILPDNDKPGLDYANQIANDLLGVAEVTYIIDLPYLKQKDDVIDFLKRFPVSELKKRLGQAQAYRPSRLLKLGQIQGIVSRSLIQVATGEKKIGFRTGYKKLDMVTGGMSPGNMWILAARPSVGKTAFALNIIENNPDKKIAVFSLEMNDTDLVQRLLAYHTGFSLTKLRNGQLSSNGDLAKLKAAQGELSKYRCMIEDTPYLSVGQMEQRVQHMSGLDLIIVDYLGIMNIPSENRNNGLGEVTNGLRALGKKMACPVLVLSQLSRNCEFRQPPRPRLSDLRDSGNIEQDADVVTFLYRARSDDGVYQNSTELIVAKNRHGACANIPLLFDYHKMHFMSRD